MCKFTWKMNKIPLVQNVYLSFYYSKLKKYFLQ